MITLRLSLCTMIIWTGRVAALNVQRNARFWNRSPVAVAVASSSSVPRILSTRLFSDNPSAVQGEKTEEEKAAIKAAREARKAEKERKKAEKKAKKAAQAALLAEENKPIEAVTFLSVEDAPEQNICHLG